MEVYTRKYTPPSQGSRPGLGVCASPVGSNESGYYRWWTIGMQITSGRPQDLDKEAGRCGVVHGETGESGAVPYTLSESSRLSYWIGKDPLSVHLGSSKLSNWFPYACTLSRPLFKCNALEPRLGNSSAKGIVGHRETRESARAERELYQ